MINLEDFSLDLSVEDFSTNGILWIKKSIAKATEKTH